METKYISRHILVLLVGPGILHELQAHLRSDVPSIEFPSKFIVTIDTSCEDDINGLKYYHSSVGEEPFLIMGSSDSGFLTTCALLISVGTNLED